MITDFSTLMNDSLTKIVMMLLSLYVELLARRYLHRVAQIGSVLQEQLQLPYLQKDFI